MACNCKNINNLENKYGEEEQESLFTSFIRYGIKSALMVVSIVMTLVVVPIIAIVGLYKAFFSDGRITLPRFLGKYLKK